MWPDRLSGLTGVSNQPSQSVGSIQGLLHKITFLQFGQLRGTRVGENDFRSRSITFQSLQRGKILQIKKDAAGGCNQNNHNDSCNGNQPVCSTAVVKGTLGNDLN